MTDLVQEFVDLERSFRCGAPLPNLSDGFDPYEFDQGQIGDEESYEFALDDDDDVILLAIAMSETQSESTWSALPLVDPTIAK